MAACGINEHKEGCRKQRVIDRAAAAKCMKLAGIERPAVRECDPDDPEALGFMRKCGSPPGITGNFGPSLDAAPSYRNGLLDMEGQHSPTAIDRLRREGVRQQQLVTYSAKVPNRLSSINYTQQW